MTLSPPHFPVFQIIIRLPDLFLVMGNELLLLQQQNLRTEKESIIPDLELEIDILAAMI
jgi:hypothetical protein